MCNLYSQTKSQDAMRNLFDDIAEDGESFEDTTGNLPPMTAIWPDYAAPIIRRGANGGWELTKARWGMPTLGAIPMQSGAFVFWIIWRSLKQRWTLLGRNGPSFCTQLNANS